MSSAGGCWRCGGQRLAWLHIPAAIWGALIEFTGWICPLTPLENYFLELAGSNAYEGDFIARYLWPVIYPAGLTPTVQNILGGIVIVLNCIIYTIVFIRARKR